MNLKYQKYLIILFLFSINLILSSTFIVYENKWYVYIFFLALISVINSFSVLLILLYKMIKKSNYLQHRTTPKNYIYMLACYNESTDELTNCINSITCQQTLNGDKRCILIVCDGMVKGKGNDNNTNIILKNILKINTLAEYFQYKTWDDTLNSCEIYNGDYTYKNIIIPYIYIIKHINYGKRDSLVLARELCYFYNSSINNNINKSNNNITITNSIILDDLKLHVIKILHNIYNDIRDKSAIIEYIIGIDADTIFDYNCSYELIKEIDKDNTIYGTVGYVDISPSMNFMSPFILYQYGEYMYSQCLKRLAQSTITHKVNCLSGCNQILRISEETCGPFILKKLNYLPKEDESIFNHIRSYASEDRNHVCLFLSLYPYVKTTQTLKAIAYTIVPTSVNVFISQRRRWCLGANCNDMMLVGMPGINIFERISAFASTSTFSLLPFVFIATILFIKALILNPTYLMLLLGIIMIIPFIYSLMIPIFIKKMSFRDSLYYYISFIFFLSCSFCVNLSIYIYSLSFMDIIKWGKTRNIESIENTSIENPITNSINTGLDEESEIVNTPTSENFNNNYIDLDNQNLTMSNIKQSYLIESTII